MSQPNPDLKQAFDLIKAGNKARAVDLLLPILKVDEDNADAWWLMANALTEPDDIREALDNVLRLRPDNDRARQMLTKLNQRYPPKTARDEFAFDDNDDLFGDEYDEAPRKARSTDAAFNVEKPKSGTNPLVMILAIFGVIGVVGCGICLLATTAGAFTFGQVINEVVSDPSFATAAAAIGDENAMATLGAAMNELSENLPAGSNQTLPTDLRMIGGVERGQTVTETVDSLDDDGWTLSGTSGSSFTLELNAVSPELDPQLYIYNPDGTLLAENDDISFGTNNNASLTVTLPQDGTYTIVVSAFGMGGDYELIIS